MPFELITELWTFHTTWPSSFRYVAASYTWTALHAVTWLLVSAIYLIAFRVNFVKNTSFQY